MVAIIRRRNSVHLSGKTLAVKRRGIYNACLDFSLFEVSQERVNIHADASASFPTDGIFLFYNGINRQKNGVT